MAVYPGVALMAPQLVERVMRAVDSYDPDALGAADADVRRLVTSLVAVPGPNAAGVLMELADLYSELRAHCEAQRLHLQRLLGDHHRTQAGLSAYRSSGATSLKA